MKSKQKTSKLDHITKIQKKLDESYKNVMAVATMVASIVAAIDRFYKTSSFWFFVASGVAVICALAWVGLWFRSRKSDSKAEAEAEPELESPHAGHPSVEVQAEPKTPEPIATPPQAELRPRFLDYTEDDIDDFHWEWEWMPVAAKPNPEHIASLACFCPKCKKRIKIEEKSRSERVEYGEQHPGIPANLPRRAYNRTISYIEFACDNRCLGTTTRQSNLNTEYDRIKREIERRARAIMAGNDA
jgi:hypothetical protein